MGMAFPWTCSEFNVEKSLGVLLSAKERARGQRASELFKSI